MENKLQELLHLLQQPNAAIDDLARSELFIPAPRSFTLEESTRLTYQRAKAIAKAYGMFSLFALLLYATTN